LTRVILKNSKNKNKNKLKLNSKRKNTMHLFFKCKRPTLLIISSINLGCVWSGIWFGKVNLKEKKSWSWRYS